MRAAALAALLAAGGCAHARPGAEPVVAEGWAAEAPGGDEEVARRRAVADALRRAVERAAGVSLTARTRLRDGAALSSRVVADAAGCVRRYEVLEEGRARGGRRALVRAEVLPPSSCGRSPLPPAALEDAAVEVRVTGRGALGRGAARAAASALRARLAERGWRVVESGAPWRLSGRADVEPVRDARVAPFTGAVAELSLRAERADGSLMWEGRGSASALDADTPAAGSRAAARAAEVAAAGAADALEGGLWDSSRH